MDIQELTKNLRIEKVGELYVAKTRYNSRLFTAVEQSIEKATEQILQTIAIYRSTNAWKGYK